ncbi:MAG: outer membrane protein assembly factor BamA [Bacteroidales bacterium]|jgi:outer membrane protein insertion porin family|nr:outer membrane protein assembly factor BamA [Bacteroidales bacterium]
MGRSVFSQDALSRNVEYIDYIKPRTYEIASIEVYGVTSLDPYSISMISGLSQGQKITIPGYEIGDAIEKLWKQNIFGGVQIYANAITDKLIYLAIELEELPRITKITYKGVKSYEAKKVGEEMDIKKNDVFTENKIRNAKNRLIGYFKKKGYYKVDIDIQHLNDTASRNAVNLVVNVNKGNKFKIKEIEITGNVAPREYDKDESYLAFKKAWHKIEGSNKKEFAKVRILRNLKNTKEKHWWRFWKRSKFVEPDWKDDLKKLQEKYAEEGFRDMRITRDTVYEISNKLLKVELDISEGDIYHFGGIKFIGNTKYSSEFLAAILDIKKGDKYNETKFRENLSFNPRNGDITSLYYDDGYLTFSAFPVETSVQDRTVDIEIRLHEGKQFRVKQVDVTGNTRTNDYVILREINIYPGDLFSRAAIINSVNELRQLRYFNEEKINPAPVNQNVEEGTVDILYTVEEVGSDQLELSGGWGGGMIVGTLGFSFNNFSIQNLFRKDAWRPLPTGNGQKLSIRAQTNGSQYYSFSGSFTEPWLGGRKPYAFSLSSYHTMQSNGLSKESAMRAQLNVTGASMGLGMRLTKPDHFFTLYQSLGFQMYKIYNYSSLFPVTDGTYRNFSYTVTLSRHFLDGAIFPKNGSDISLTLQVTPPYSYLDKKDYTDQSMSDPKRYAWLEFYKWSFKASWFVNPVANLVFNARIRMGGIGQYNRNVGYTPFERYKLGGDGMTGYSYAGHEMIAMRGYSNESLSPSTGATAFTKMTFEMRYPISLNPAATIYALAFVEAGNSWGSTREVNPFKLYRSAGVGVRLFLAAMGMFGLDWGWGFDNVPGKPDANGSQFAFSINQSLD